MGFDNVCLQRRDLRGLAMHHCDTDSNAWFHCSLSEVDLWQQPNGEKNGTSIVRCWDVWAAVAAGCLVYSPCVCPPSSALYRRDPSAPCIENVSLSNTFDSAALNHLLTGFMEFSVWQCSAWKKSRVAGSQGARRTICKIDLSFYLGRKNV